MENRRELTRSEQFFRMERPAFLKQFRRKHQALLTQTGLSQLDRRAAAERAFRSFIFRTSLAQHRLALAAL